MAAGEIRAFMVLPATRSVVRRRCGACHRAALRADPLALLTMRVCDAEASEECERVGPAGSTWERGEVVRQTHTPHQNAGRLDVAADCAGGAVNKKLRLVFPRRKRRSRVGLNCAMSSGSLPSNGSDSKRQRSLPIPKAAAIMTTFL